VIGTLSATNYALFVSHSHPEGHVSTISASKHESSLLMNLFQVHFSVYTTPKIGKPWGAFTTDTQVSREHGPSYDESGDTNPVQESKVSSHGGPWDTVLVGRLRFKPDILEPTSK
jgi:abelson tyrosine-protein kinase 1